MEFIKELQNLKTINRRRINNVREGNYEK